ncbi:MAG: hypothetical protein V3T17_10360 [Pseudomonadales bacterium]
MMKQTVKSLSLVCLLLLLPCSLLEAQAFCALRDPQQGIYTLFPQATSYRSVVRTIDDYTKQKVEERLAFQTLHFSELGRHTLYVALDGELPLGFIHVRSEESRWGLVEVVWALDINLHIIDFTFQRCRDSRKKLLQTEVFRNQLRGNNFLDLVMLLKPGTAELQPNSLELPVGVEDLAQVLIRCGIKTLLITEIAWREDIEKIQNFQRAYKAFGKFDRIDQVNSPYTQVVTDKLKVVYGQAPLGKHNVAVLQVYDKKNNLFGTLYRQTLIMHGQPTTLWWAIQSDNTIVNVENPEGWRTSLDRQAFNNLWGRRFEQLEHCSNRAELMALEATIIANH